MAYSAIGIIDVATCHLQIPRQSLFRPRLQLASLLVYSGVYFKAAPELDLMSEKV